MDGLKRRDPAKAARAREFWSRRYGRPVSDAEVSEIDRNLFGYYGLLLQWKREEDQKAAGQKGLDYVQETR